MVHADRRAFLQSAAAALTASLPDAAHASVKENPYRIAGRPGAAEAWVGAALTFHYHFFRLAWRRALYWQKTNMPKRKIQKMPMVCQYQAAQSTTTCRISMRRRKMIASIAPVSARTPISKWIPWVPVMR
jgi:hypothetical protein